MTKYALPQGVIHYYNQEKLYEVFRGLYKLNKMFFNILFKRFD